MRRVSFILVIMGLFLASCAGAAPTSTPVPTNTPAASSGGGQAAAQTDYVASDPALFGKSGRPQIVEFFCV